MTYTLKVVWILTNDICSVSNQWSIEGREGTVRPRLSIHKNFPFSTHFEVLETEVSPYQQWRLQLGLGPLAVQRHFVACRAVIYRGTNVHPFTLSNCLHDHDDDT